MGRTDMLIFSNTICFKTVQGFVDQTFFLCLMGPFLCLMSICMFAAIRCPLQKYEDLNKVAPVGMGQQQMKMNNNTGNPYINNYAPQNQANTGYVQVDYSKTENSHNNYYAPQNQANTGYVQSGSY